MTPSRRGQTPPRQRYWQRKNRELAFLRAFAGSTATVPSVSDLPDFLAAVRRLRQDIRTEQARRSGGLFETSLAGVETYEGPFGSLTYRYQRVDLARTEVDWLAHIYARDGLDRASDGLFVHSGMSAIGAALHTIVSLGWQGIDISRTAYYETLQLLSRFFPGLEVRFAQDGSAAHGDITWLDTSSTERPDASQGGPRPRLLVVDTSNVEPDAAVVEEWLASSAAVGCPLLLIRSHLKLDSFGLELGKLGSIVIVAPDADRSSIEPIARGLRQASAGLGLFFEIPNLYPWLGMPEFLELAAARAAGIRAATEATASALEAARLDDDVFEVIQTDHQLFFRIRTGLTPGEDATAAGNDLTLSLAAACDREKVPAVIGSSFGLDRFIFRDYVDEADGELYLRVSGADLPFEHVSRLGPLIRDVLAAARSRD